MPHQTETLPNCLPLLHIPGNLILFLFGPSSENMRAVSRYLSIIAIAALLIPELRWASPSSSGDACACPPVACMCVGGHHHAVGHGCCAGKRAECGFHSHNGYLQSILSTLSYEATEYPWWNPLPSSKRGVEASPLSLLPSHARIPDQPPRSSF